MINVLLGFLVTEDFGGIDPDDLVVGIFDISRARFMAPAEREFYIALPKEDRPPGDDMVGRLIRMMYGFRDASNGWVQDWPALLCSNKYKVFPLFCQALSLFKLEKSRVAGLEYDRQRHTSHPAGCSHYYASTSMHARSARHASSISN